jgi:hypothetical protein
LGAVASADLCNLRSNLAELCATGGQTLSGMICTGIIQEKKNKIIFGGMKYLLYLCTEQNKTSYDLQKHLTS